MRNIARSRGAVGKSRHHSPCIRRLHLQPLRDQIENFRIHRTDRDVAQLQKDNPDLKWLFPVEGTMKAVDSAFILQGAANPHGAESFLNYVYDPEVAGPLYEAIQYPAPVKGAVDHMSAAAKSSGFLNPTGNLVEFRVLSPGEDNELSEAFARATQQ